MYLAIIGFDEIVSIKYADLFFDAIEAGTLDGYYIVDLRSQEASITKRLEAMRIRPVSVIYLKDDGWEEDFKRKFGAICQQKQFRVYIAAEAKKRISITQGPSRRATRVLLPVSLLIHGSEEMKQTVYSLSICFYSSSPLQAPYKAPIHSS